MKRDRAFGGIVHIALVFLLATTVHRWRKRFSFEKRSLLALVSSSFDYHLLNNQIKTSEWIVCSSGKHRAPLLVAYAPHSEEAVHFRSDPSPAATERVRL